MTAIVEANHDEKGIIWPAGLSPYNFFLMGIGKSFRKGSFYYRFSNKYELYLHLLKEGSRRKWEFINSDQNTDLGFGKEIFDLFRIQAESGVRFAKAHPRYYFLSRMFSKEKETAIYYRVLEDLNAPDESA